MGREFEGQDPRRRRALQAVLSWWKLSLPVVREIESACQAHLGATRTRELRRILEAQREIAAPFAEPKVADPAGTLMGTPHLMPIMRLL